MKVLKNAKFTGNIKINDTNTDIYFQAYDDGVLQKLNADQCSFRIKNDTGYLITISNVSTETDYITFKSNELKPLPVGTYYLELWVEDSTGTYIYPDESFCKLRINENVTVAQGTTIPTISLEEYENKLQGYVDTAVADGTQKIESDFDKYVDSITDSTIATATKASQDAATAINTANSANAAAQNATNIANAAKSNADTASQNASTALDTANTAKSMADSASQTAATATENASTALSNSINAKSTAENAVDTANSALAKSELVSSTGWLQTGLIFPTNALSKKGFYKIDTINDSSVLEFYVTVVYAKTDVDSWGDVIFTLPSNVTVLNGANYFYDCYTNYGYGNLKYRNGSIIVNQPANFGNADSTGNYEIDVHGRIPVSINS